jgi:hypothetical protein
MNLNNTLQQQQRALTPFNTLYLDARSSTRPQHTHITKVYTHADAMVYGAKHDTNYEWLHYDSMGEMVTPNKQALLSHFSRFFNDICPLEVDATKYLAYLNEVGAKGITTKLSMPNHRLKQMIVGAN